MNRFQLKVAKETLKKLDLDNKIEEFTKMLTEAKNIEERDKVLNLIDEIPSWYSVKKSVKKDLKNKTK